MEHYSDSEFDQDSEIEISIDDNLEVKLITDSSYTFAVYFISCRFCI